MVLEMGKRAKEAAGVLAVCGTAQKNKALAAIADALTERTGLIEEANSRDMKSAEEAGTSPAMLDRLRLDAARIRSIADAVREVIALDDPIGETVSMSRRENGLIIGRRRVPLGVIGIIYEARPNVTVDAAVLCLKSGNAVILRGGKEAINSNIALADIMRDAVKSAGLPEDCIQLVSDIDRKTAQEMMGLTQYIDVLIPRGGGGLIKTVMENAKVPVIQTGVGNCHVFVDESADTDMAVSIIVNAKCSRPSVCNAAETLLVHAETAHSFLPRAYTALREKNVELRGCPVTRAILGDKIIPATDEDWDTEFLDYILAVRVVEDFDQAVAHIAAHGSGHSEAIVTSDYSAAQAFLDRVDAAAVYVNASTRFTDGGQFGTGAEIGISTQKMHARGPMGLKELTSTKFVIYGDGQSRV